MSDAPKGFWIFAHDWNSNSALRVCSAGAERVFIRLCCLVSETQDYGVLSFNDGNDWRCLADLFPGGKWFGIPLRDNDHLGSVPGQVGRPRLKKNSEKTRRKLGENEEKTRILRVFQELAKRLGLESNVTARGFVELATKGVLSLNSDSYPCVDFMARQEKERAAWRFRKGKSRQKATYVTLYPSPSPIYSPIVPSKRGDGNGASVDSKADKRLRKSEARRRAAMQVGADECYDNGGDNSPAARFRDAYFAAGGDPARLVEAHKELFQKWETAPPTAQKEIFRNWRNRVH